MQNSGNKKEKKEIEWQIRMEKVSMSRNMPLCHTFVDYEKAFDSVERTDISNVLYVQGINETFIKLIENVYANETSVVQLHKDTEKIKNEKGVRRVTHTHQNYSLLVLKKYSESFLENQKG